MYREWKKIESQKGIIYKFGNNKLWGRPRNRWQDEAREDGRIVGGEGWQEKVHNWEVWKKLLRTARNCCILHMPMEWMNSSVTHKESTCPIIFPQCFVVFFWTFLVTWVTELSVVELMSYTQDSYSKYMHLSTHSHANGVDSSHIFIDNCHCHRWFRD